MQLNRLMLILISISCLPTAGRAQDAVRTWLAQDGPWIRVGLKKPMQTPKFKAYSPIWLLDGNTPVAKIDPKTAFWVVPSPGSGVQYWVQLQAARSTEVLRATQERVADRLPASSFRIFKLKRSKLKVLQAGPFRSKSAAQKFRKDAVALGFDDAFLARSKGGFPVAWVDDVFDKHEFPARDPAIVSADPDTQITFTGTEYRGILRFRKEGREIRVINELPLETYLRGVVPAEMGPEAFPELEALKAQAIAARTYALKNMNRFNRHGYDICDSPSCQVYHGFSVEHPLSDEAVRSTAGMVITHNGELIDALYTSTCGGHTEDVAHVFPGRSEPYLKGKSSYISGLQSWTLPSRDVPRTADDPGDAQLLVRAMLFGFERLPELEGTLTSKEFETWMEWLSWIWGPSKKPLPGKQVTWTTFYLHLASLPLMADALDHQMDSQDISRLMRGSTVKQELRKVAAFLERFGLHTPELMATLQATGAVVPKRRALAILLHLSQSLGPVPEWDTYLLEFVDGDTLVLTKGGEEHIMDLGGISYYLLGQGDALRLTSNPVVEELDYIEVPRFPFKAAVMRVVPRGKVASIDRFSRYSSWMEKRTIDEIETRAAKYIRGINGIREINILKRSATGRVTLLEYVARSGRHRVDGLRIRWSLGIRDNLFDMAPFYRDGKLVGATFFGRGWGHGVGLSQVGAFGLARVGWSHRDILSFFYSDIDIEPYRQAQ